MSLWKRGNVYWSYVYVNGVRHSKSTGTRNRRDAERRDFAFKQELLDRALKPPGFDPDMKFGELAAQFIANAGPKPHHLDRLKHLLPYFGDTPIFRINKGMVHQFVQNRQNGKRKIKESTINRDVSVLRHLLYWACDQSWMEHNPLSRFKMLRERRTKKPVLTFLEEERLLFNSQEHVRDMIVTALDTGMRRGEILNQMWEDVDFERRLLWVSRSKTPEGESREIPLTTRMCSLLMGRQKASGPIFTFHDRSVLSIKTAWKTTLRNAGIRHIRFHDLRHTFNTRLMEAGVMQDIRKALMGHSSGGGMNSVYTHVELPTKRRAIQMLETWCLQQIQFQKGGESSHESQLKSLPTEVAGLLSAGTGSDPAPD